MTDNDFKLEVLRSLGRVEGRLDQMEKHQVHSRVQKLERNQWYAGGVLATITGALAWVFSKVGLDIHFT